MENKRKIFIRAFNLLDMERILEIEKLSFAFDAFSEKTFKSFYKKCPGLFILAGIEGMIAGYMLTCIYKTKSNVISIAVAPNYRSKGMGRILVEYTLEKLKYISIKSTELEVRVTNFAGIKFWKSLGFTSFGYNHGYYSDGQDAIKMRKILSE